MKPFFYFELSFLFQMKTKFRLKHSPVFYAIGSYAQAFFYSETESLSACLDNVFRRWIIDRNLVILDKLR